MSVGGSKTTQNSQNSLNQQSTNYLQGVWNAAQGAGQQGPSPLLTGAAGYNTNLQNAGNLGLRAMTDPSQMALLMSPYTTNVINAMQQQQGVANQGILSDINSQATRAGAFGGDRAAVAQGVALAQSNLGNNAQIANLLNAGYQNAQGVAQNLAGMGYAGAGQNANLGMQGVGNQQQWLLNMLRQGWLGPTGSSGSGAQTSLGFKWSPLSMMGAG